MESQKTPARKLEKDGSTRVQRESGRTEKIDIPYLEIMWNELP